MDQDVQRILNMIENGRISAEQGEALLKALGKEQPSGTEKETEGSGEPAFVGIYVTDGNREQVRVKIPFGLVSCVEKFVPKEVMARVKAGDRDVDLGELFRNLKHCARGELLSVDGTDGTKVRICCE